MKFILPPLTAWLLAALGALALWFWLARPVDVVSVPNGRFDCLSYVPTHPGGHPLMGADYKIPDGLIERELAALKPLTDCIRTYSSYGVQGLVLPVAAQMNMKVLLGIWIGAEEARNQVEIDAALKLAEQYPSAVRAIVVGNEVLLRREMSGERLAGIIRSVKARTNLPVTYADIYEFWRRNPAVAAATDIQLLHVLPYWDDPTPVSIDDVQAHVRKIVDQMRADVPNGHIEIGEIGWPSAGRTRGYAVPSRVNQARFMREFAAQSSAVGVHYNMIEAIDQPWKRGPEGTAGGYWGLLSRDLEPKFPLTGPVSEWPDWRLAALFSALLAALFTGAAVAAGRRPAFVPALGIAAAGAATGTLQWMLAAQVTTLLGGPISHVWALYLITIAGAGGGWLAAQCAGLTPAWRSAPAPLGAWPRLSAWRRPSPAMALGLARWVVLLPAAVLAVAMATDGRHRDFLTLAFVLPALALAVQAKLAGAQTPGRPEDIWLCVILGAGGIFALDLSLNWEAISWAATCVLLAAPGWPALAAELGSLRRAAAAIGQG